MNRLIRNCKIYFASTVLIASQFLLMPSRIHAGSVDANGNALPEPSDGKSTVKAPPIVQGCAAPSDTEFRIGLPGWLSGLSGEFGVRGVVSDQDIKFTDLVQHLDMVASGSLYARYHRWEFSADGQYLKLSDTAPLRGILFDSARIALKSAFAEGFLGYRLINCQDGFLSVSAGARYNYMNADFHLRSGRRPGGRVSGSIDWVDPVLGTNGKVHIWKPVSLWAKGDVGGFGAASDFTWQVQGGLEFQVTRSMWSAIGWRYMKYDYTSGGFTNKTELNGPFMETGINF